mgnify:FL=1
MLFEFLNSCGCRMQFCLFTESSSKKICSRVLSFMQDLPDRKYLEYELQAKMYQGCIKGTGTEHYFPPF